MARKKLDPHDINRVKPENPASLRPDCSACSGMRVQFGVESVSSFTEIRTQIHRFYEDCSYRILVRPDPLMPMPDADPPFWQRGLGLLANSDSIQLHRRGPYPTAFLRAARQSSNHRRT
jgi:hypothetical protein